MFCLWFSSPAPQDKVYLQQSLAVVKKKKKRKAARQQLALSLPSPRCVTSILSDTSELEAFRGGKKHHLAVDCDSDASIFLLLLPRCLWPRAARVHVRLAVVRHTCYCGESDNVMLFETYSAYQRFFCCTYSSTLTPLCCRFFTPHRSRCCHRRNQLILRCFSCIIITADVTCKCETWNNKMSNNVRDVLLHRWFIGRETTQIRLCFDFS